MERRSLEERKKASDYGITKLAKDLTSSLDVLSLALKSVPEAFRIAPEETGHDDAHKAVFELYEGVALTQKAILDMLKMHGITCFNPIGEKFDPNEHEALYQAPVPDKEPGTVISVSKEGYRIHDRVLRAAEVGVAQDSS